MEWLGDHIVVTDKRRNQLLVNPGVLRKAYLEASSKFPNETGGILLGQLRQFDGTPIVSKCSLEPKDSISGPMKFHRGTEGIQALLDEEFEKGYSYIGEWHTHPNGPHGPSPVDIFTMGGIARKYDLPHHLPLLLILSGTPLSWNASLTCHESKLGLYTRFERIDINDVLNNVET